MKKRISYVSALTIAALAVSLAGCGPKEEVSARPERNPWPTSKK